MFAWRAEGESWTGVGETSLEVKVAPLADASFEVNLVEEAEEEGRAGRERFELKFEEDLGRRV